MVTIMSRIHLHEGGFNVPLFKMRLSVIFSSALWWGKPLTGAVHSPTPSHQSSSKKQLLFLFSFYSSIENKLGIWKIERDFKYINFWARYRV